MATSTPTWTDNVTLLAATTLDKGITSNRSTFDWRTKWGGFVFARVGRTGTTALTAGVKVIVRRTINNDGTLNVAGANPMLVSQTAAATGTACASSGNNAGVTTLTLNTTASYTAGDIIYIDGAGSGNKEYCRVAVTSSASTSLIIDAPTKLAHNSTSDVVRNKADQWAVWVEGGATYELLFDYGESTTGESVAIEAFAQTLDSISIV